MPMSRVARLVIAVAIAGGLAVLGQAVAAVVGARFLDDVQLGILAIVGLLVTASWIWPLMIFVDRQSKSLQFDEYCLMVLVLLAPPEAVVLTFAGATIVAQAIRRRPLVKSAFNVGQVLLSVGAGVLVFRLLAPAGAALGRQPIPLAASGTDFYWTLGSAIAAAAAYFVVNTASVGTVLVATGTPWRTALGKGLDSRLAFTAASVVVALTTAVVVADQPWLMVLAVVPPVMLRLVLADQFEARRDRARVKGLFDATLRANRSMGESDVAQAIVSSARALLRCTDASLTEHPVDGCLQARVVLPDRHLWLTVSGRSRTEPFDPADQDLLDALAAVGTGALSNAWLYEEGRHQRERLSAITSSMAEGVCALTATGEITFLNPAAAAMLGWGPTDSEGPGGLPAGRGVGYRAPNFILSPARRAQETATTVTGYDTRFERGDGSVLHVAFTASPIVNQGAPPGAVVVFRDITERKEFEERLARHAFHDSLTGLPNRRLFLDHLDHALRRSARSHEVHAVLFADVDRFKIINDSLGHHAGDHLLVAIAERLQGSMRAGDMLARFGGDEFTILLEGVPSPEDAEMAAKRILTQMRRPIALPDGHEVVASLSIGIALTAPGRSRDDLLHNADVAMYQAKGKGRNGHYELYDAAAMGARSAERIELEAGLRRALRRHELEVHYQPLFSIADGHIVGAEALVRWRHPERGLLGPSSFIGLAEESGLILPLGHQVLQDACRQARRWRETFGTKLVVSVNLSARQFQQAGLVEEIEHLLEQSGVDPSQLSVEITESLAMEDVGRTRDILVSLKELGIQVAIDDFGTGYSALGYLTHFPVDVVKIDRSFVEDVEVDPVKSAIVSAVIRLSEAIGTVAVVEGVETERQLRHLRALGCPEAQGFHLAQPMSSTELDDVLRAQLGADTEMVAVG
jgi:diguanylate cyclase (GGDEF)-like protein/PAS domain S-box-containing protein